MTKYDHRSIHDRGSTLKEVVFGAEDGMVSTLGAITGIAIGSQDHATVILAGAVIIAVESISMGVGSYLSHRSQEDMRQQVIREEKEELSDYPKEEAQELTQLFIRDGWPKDFARQMTQVAKEKRPLMLREMKYRELQVLSPGKATPLRKGLFMFFSYIGGGIIPLVMYFFLPLSPAIGMSIGLTLAGLFALGAISSRFTGVSWLKSGGRILLLGGIALIIGLVVGNVFGRPAA